MTPWLSNYCQKRTRSAVPFMMNSTALLDTAGQRGQASPALLDRIAAKDAEWRLSRATANGLTARLREVAGPSRQARLAELVGAASAEPVDRSATNAALRVLMAGIVIDYLTGQLVFQWKHGAESIVMFTWSAEALA